MSPVRAATVLFWAAIALAGAGSAVGQEPADTAAPEAAVDDEAISEAIDAEAAAIFELFNHRRHQGVLEDRGVSCVSCHQIGASGDPRISMPRLESWVEPPPQGACHFCHNPPDGEQPTGTARCILCHDVIQPPPSHGAGWVDLHGTEARLATWSCDSCHRRSFCIDCHERKEAARYEVHDRAWLTIHGIAARANPAECGTCHLQTDCISCHATTDGRLR